MSRRSEVAHRVRYERAKARRLIALSPVFARSLVRAAAYADIRAMAQVQLLVTRRDRGTQFLPRA